MSSLTVTDKYVAVSKNLQINLYDYANHTIVDVPCPSKSQEEDRLADIAISSDNEYLAAITSISKLLILYKLPLTTTPTLFTLPRSASKIRFTVNNKNILVADKTGDVFIFDLSVGDKGNKLLGHLSLLLDILQTYDEKYIITSDRDEKIKVSCYPNTYNIQTYCLGHKEFVNHIELLPHNNMLLVSSSGDGTLKVWEYLKGNICYTIDTFFNIEDDQLKNDFIRKMDKEEIEVEALPIIHLAVTKLTDRKSLVAASVFNCNDLLIYSITSTNENISHKLETKLKLSFFPTAIQVNNSKLLIYNDSDNSLTYYKFICSNDTVSFNNIKIEKVFENISHAEQTNFESVKLLYKRKFDNVQEYLERKKQRLEKASIKSDE